MVMESVSLPCGEGSSVLGQRVLPSSLRGQALPTRTAGGQEPAVRGAVSCGGVGEANASRFHHSTSREEGPRSGRGRRRDGGVGCSRCWGQASRMPGELESTAERGVACEGGTGVL